MGEYADLALEHLMDVDEFQQVHALDDPASMPDDVWEALHDERGVQYAPVFAGAFRCKKEPFSVTRTCPRCGGPMEVREGKHGKFAGCLSFPACKGNRDLT